MSVATYWVGLNLNNDADYLDAGEVVTADVLARTGIRTFRGADFTRPLLVPRAGEAAYELRNDDGTYAIGVISQGDPTKITASDGTEYTLFEGEVDRTE